MLGRGWQTCTAWQINDRARELEQAAGFARLVARHLRAGEFATAGEAMAAASAAQRPAAEWETPADV
jgi:hypothetical protein